MERLDLMHELLVAVVGFQLFLAPVDGSKIHRALDLGTGTGICMSKATTSATNYYAARALIVRTTRGHRVRRQIS